MAGGLHGARNSQLSSWPVASANVVTIMKDTAGNILDCYGNTVPTDGTAGYAVGCIFRHMDGGSVNAILYVNAAGTTTSCNFDAAAV